MGSTLIQTALPGGTTRVAPQRVQSVDVLRGLTIALMILVNDPGDWDHVFPQLDHAAWNGWTLTDLVFPTFLFLVGASLVFSMSSRRAKGDCRGTSVGHLFARTGKILLLQFVLVFFPRMHWQGMRTYGVLPRIALCYLLAGLVLVAVSGLRGEQSRVMVLVSVVAALLLGYWVLLRFVPVPGVGMPGRDVPLLDMTGNLTAWMDQRVSGWLMRWVHVGKLYRPGRDPEGLLSTLPAVATTLLGSLAAMWMRRVPGAKAPISVTANVRAEARTYPKTQSSAEAQSYLVRTCLGLAAAGVAGIVAGTVWGWWFPVNKNLWTSSYVLLAAGWAALALAALAWLLDARPQPWPRWLRVSTWPWFVFGSNAIAAFTVSVVIVKAMLYFKVADSDGDLHSWWELTYENVFARHGSTEWTSLAFGLCFVMVCFLPNWWLWRRKWFLKI